MVWPAIIAAGASVAGGVMQDKGQKTANKQNLKIAREQMAFQERMSNTAYQRSAKDLSAAGLNRILALGSPASSPSGALATMQSTTAGKADALKTGTASALQARIANMQFKNLQADTMNKAETNNLIREQTLNERAKTTISSAQGQMLNRTNDALGITQPATEAIKKYIPMLHGIGSRAGKALPSVINHWKSQYKKLGRNADITWEQFKQRKIRADRKRGIHHGVN